MLAVSRRSLLRLGATALGTGALAGCVGGGRLRRYRIGADAVPAGLPAAIEAAATVPPSREHPLVVEITFTSTAVSRMTFAVRPTSPFPFGTGTATNRSPSAGPSPRPGAAPRRLVVAPRGSRGELIDECWRDTDTGGSDSVDQATSRIDLDPGESVSAEVVVVNHPENAGCYPFGSYHFNETFWSGEAVEARGGDSGHAWGFTLDIVGLERVERDGGGR